jgi:general secretion pathway protein A
MRGRGASFRANEIESDCEQQLSARSSSIHNAVRHQGADGQAHASSYTPEVLRGRLLTPPMYHRHFGLTGPPFQFTPAPNALYLSQTHREVLATLEWGLLHEPTGFTLIVGESGVGKTTMISSMLLRRYRGVRIAFLNNPRLDFDQMMQVVMSQLAPGWNGQTRLELNERFGRLLDDLEPGERAAIVIDEAQELSDGAFEGLRLLSNSDSFEERRLQIIFAGQPLLLERLQRPSMRSLNQRIGARSLLRPLSPAEVREYIDCRLRAKGATANRIFAPDALKYLIAHSGGIPRQVNVLSHNSMLQGYAASSRNVTLPMVRKAVAEYEDLLRAKRDQAGESSGAKSPRPHLMRAVAATAIAAAAAGAIFAWSQSWLSSSQSYANVGGAAIRSAAGPYKTGPGIPLRPGASAATVPGTSNQPHTRSHAEP